MGTAPRAIRLIVAGLTVVALAGAVFLWTRVNRDTRVASDGAESNARQSANDVPSIRWLQEATSGAVFGPFPPPPDSPGDWMAVALLDENPVVVYNRVVGSAEAAGFRTAGVADEPCFQVPQDEEIGTRQRQDLGAELPPGTYIVSVECEAIAVRDSTAVHFDMVFRPEPERIHLTSGQSTITVTRRTWDQGRALPGTPAIETDEASLDLPEPTNVRGIFADWMLKVPSRDEVLAVSAARGCLYILLDSPRPPAAAIHAVVTEAGWPSGFDVVTRSLDDRPAASTQGQIPAGGPQLALSAIETNEGPSLVLARTC